MIEQQDVKMIREQKGMTQRELAKKAHVASATISNIENGDHETRDKIMNRVRRALGGKVKQEKEWTECDICNHGGKYTNNCDVFVDRRSKLENADGSCKAYK